MKNFKKALSVLLVTVMLLCAAPMAGFVGLEISDFDFNLSADAAEIVDSGTCGTNVTYTLDSDGLLTIAGTGAMWVSILPPWYSNCSAIKTVSIENGVTSIGDEVFRYCTKLTSVTIPDSVTSIEDGAFYECDSLGEIVIENKDCQIYDSSNTIPANAFLRGHDDSTAQIYAEEYNRVFVSIDGAGSDIILSGYCGDNADFTLTRGGTLQITGTGAVYSYNPSTARPWYKYRGFIRTVIIEDGITEIGDDLFTYCTKLTSVTIGDSVTSIGDSAFKGCRSLTSVTIPDSVTSIGEDAFFGCDSLTSVTIGDSVTSIGNSAFSGCELLTSVTIPDSVTSIKGSAFYNCTSLTSVTIPDSVTSIGDRAFNDCTSLTSVTIPDSVTSIGYYAFDGCRSLTSVHISDIAAWCNIDFDGFYANPLCYAHNLYLNGTLVTTLTIPDSVTSIGDYAFEGCTSLTSVTIPDSVTSIGDSAFEYCTSLTSVTIPDSVMSIGGSAFRGCTSLTSVTIPDNVTSIGKLAFCNCTSLTDITVDADNTTYCSEDGVLFNKSKTELIQYPVGNARTSYTIPDSVTSIGYSAFEGCTKLTSVTISGSVTNIVRSAFCNCTSLTSVTIGNSVTSIGNDAFYYCTSLTDVYYEGKEEQWAKISIGYHNTPLANATIHYNSADKYTMKIKGNNGATNSVAKGEEVTFYVYLLKNGEYVPCKNNYAFSFDNPGVFEAISVGRNNDCFAVKLKAQNIGSTNMTISDDESGAKITIQLRSNMPLSAVTFDDVKEQGTFYEHGSYHYWNYYYDYNGLYVNDFSYSKSDNNYYIDMNVFNEKAHYGAVVSYDKDGNVADYKLINQMDKLPTSLWDGLFDSFDLTNAWLGKGLPGEYLFVNGTLAKETPIRDLKVPEGGYLVISNNCVANEFVFLANVLDITIDCSLAISKIPCSETNEAAKNVIEDILNNFLPDALGKLSTDVITNLIKELSFNNIGDVLVELSKEFEKADIDLWKILKDSINAEFGFSLAEGIAFQMLGLDFIADIFGYTNTMIKMFDINCSQKAPQIAIYAPASSSTSRTSNGITVSSASSMNSSYVLHTYLLNDSSRKMSQAKPTIESISKNYEMYDISLYKKGEAAQPETEIEIFIPIPAGMNKNRVQVYWYKDDGTLESMNAEVRGSYAVFKTNHLSYYIICEQLAPLFVIGDVDNNGKIESTDARLALRAAVKLETLTEAQTKAADADKDGEITSSDARLILRAAVGLETL